MKWWTLRKQERLSHNERSQIARTSGECFPLGCRQPRVRHALSDRDGDRLATQYVARLTRPATRFVDQLKRCTIESWNANTFTHGAAERLYCSVIS